MATQDDAITFGILLNCLFEQYAQFETGALPRKPDEGVAKTLIKLKHLVVTIGSRGQRYPPIRVKVVDMCERQKSMQRCVNRRRDTIPSETTQWIHLDHFVFVFGTAIALGQRRKLF